MIFLCISFDFKKALLMWWYVEEITPVSVIPYKDSQVSVYTCPHGNDLLYK